MEKSRLPLWLASVGMSFALGFGVAWVMRAPVAAVGPALAMQAGPAQAAAGANPFPDIGGAPGQARALPGSGLAEHASVDELWRLALAPQGSQQSGFDAEDRLRKMAQTNPVALRKLLQRYESERSPQARDLLKSILSTVQTPEVLAFALRLAGSSNTAERKYGFEMVEAVAPDSPEVRALVKRTLDSEQSSEVLVQALQALKPAAVEPEESDQLVAQLKTLSQHADAAVRRQAVMQLGQWDKKGEGADSLVQALSDRSLEVRQSAIFALAQTGVRTDAAKGALMAIATNAQESKEIRGSALQALERFSLSKEEYAAFARARAQIQG